MYSLENMQVTKFISRKRIHNTYVRIISDNKMATIGEILYQFYIGMFSDMLGIDN